VRKFIALAAGVMLLAAATVAFGAEGTSGNVTEHFTLAVSPAKKSSKKKPRKVRLTIHTNATTADGSEPDPIRKLDIAIAKGFKINGTKFPRCSASTLTGAGPDSCAKGSLVGTGLATADVPGLLQGAQANVTVYNSSGKTGASKLVLFINSPQIKVAIEARASSTSGKFGTHLVATVPNLTVLGRPAVLTALDAKIGATRKGVGLFTAPTTCNGSWPFEVKYTRDTSLITADGSTPCS
jgi:hypothetical protein